MHDLYHQHLHSVVAQHLTKARTPLQLVHAAQKLAKSVHRIADAHRERGGGGNKEALRNAVFRDVTGLRDGSETNVRAVRLACRFGWDDVVKAATGAASAVKGVVSNVAGSVLDTVGKVSLAGVAEFIKTVAPSVVSKYEESKGWVVDAIETGQHIMNGGLKMHHIAEQVIDAYDTTKACIGGDASKCAQVGPALRDTITGLREAVSMFTSGGGAAAASCTVPGKGEGTCVPMTQCGGGTSHKGFCTGAADIQCCIR